MRILITSGLLSLMTFSSASAQTLNPLDPGVGGMSIGERALRPGDIILSTTGGRVSKAIRDVTGAPVSHAMLYLGNGKVVDAVLGGVRQVSLNNALKDATLAVAFHHPGLDQTTAQKVVDFAKREARLRKKYNLKGVGQQFLCYSRDALCFYPGTGKRWYCSELVLGAYRKAGLRVLLHRSGKKAPGELARNSVLRYVGHLRTSP